MNAKMLNGMATHIVFETHSISDDNVKGQESGWQGVAKSGMMSLQAKRVPDPRPEFSSLVPPPGPEPEQESREDENKRSGQSRYWSTNEILRFAQDDNHHFDEFHSLQPCDGNMPDIVAVHLS